MSEVKKIYVTDDLKALVICPECGKKVRTDVSRFMAHETEIKLKCTCPSCHHKFPAILERRKSIRKEVNFPGWIRFKDNKYNVSIKDISKQGLKILLHKELSLDSGSIINVRFKLDDETGSSINKEVRVKTFFSPTKIGCDFLDPSPTGDLTKYFMFHY